ncbi:sensor histidine kinase [Lachnospiraceae bacterium WCA-9-b2]|uniref:histidine kinase n=1 Tax=Sporofaciens musculi TaxID=2681861 RepID=A0A7X3MM84_9FIRM|nr:HAMP domain-containing sensor histidine kinase [Sporofaciens musculi]MXP78860.1 sensor histidine kinase [Sporofaciens musculi]
MKQRWYRSRLTKGLLIILEHVLVVAAAVSILWAMSYPTLVSEVFSGSGAKEYEDTDIFKNRLMDLNCEIMNGIRVQELFESDGAYNPQKIIDIQEYAQTYGEEIRFPNENVHGLAYTLGDLIAWGENRDFVGNDLYTDEGGLEDKIIVCRRPDKTFHYYYYSEFKKLINTGELRFVIANDDSGISEDDILAELRAGNFTNNSETAFKGLQDIEGKIVYIDCWSYDGGWMEEKYKPIDAESIMQVANDNPEWNGRLNNAYAMLNNTIYSLRDAYSSYVWMENGYKEGDTNLTYLYVDTENGRVYTNRNEFRDYGKLRENLEKLRKAGKYAIIEPELKDFESNIEGIKASLWRDSIKYVGAKETGFIYAISVDTDYPIKDGLHSEAHEFEKYSPFVRGVLILGISSALLFVGILIWLTAAAEAKLNWFDRWKTELAAAAVVLAWAVPVIVIIYGSGSLLAVASRSISQLTYYETDYGYTSASGTLAAGGMLAAYTCAMFLMGYLSLVRRIKAKSLWKDSLLRSMICFTRRAFANIHAVWKAVAIFAMFVFVHWIAVLSNSNRYAMFLMLAGELVVFIYMVRQASGRQKIDIGVDRIAGGEVDYKIPLEGLGDEQKNIAEKINSIGQGLDAALEESIKSERLKTDLITNVSHDIKTPLTSIINYVNLLKQEKFDDPKILRYLDILDEKSQRLKTLTEDVVEASKVSSGNITLEYMNINLVEIIQQTSGEFEEKFTANELTEVMSLPEHEVIIRADGRRLWRVLANIYNNAAKYAMKGTRVYADLYTIGDAAVFSLKNVSDQPLNISADELTERFIRGDISRGTEGSGLGLSIAKTLTQMQGGNFELYLDGDLFRVTITFPKVNI